MPGRALPKSVRASAAASVVACTACMVAEQAEAAPVWIDAPHLEGQFDPNVVTFPTIDFDQDGLNEFLLYFTFYNSYFGLSVRPDFQNPNSDFLFDSYILLFGEPNYRIVPTAFESRDDVYSAATAYTPFPRPIDIIHSLDSMENYFGSRAMLGSVFVGGDSNTYVAYLDMEMSSGGGNTELAFLTIYDAGYALVPEPSSLALLGLGGLLLARRRRGA